MAKKMIDLRGKKRQVKNIGVRSPRRQTTTVICSRTGHIGTTFTNQESFGTVWEVQGSCLKVTVFKLSK